ncbi:MAG: response regulator [Verrucomicrobia bacterium]|nr:response regulator [Verrucomicrobiota bacterium]
MNRDPRVMKAAAAALLLALLAAGVLGSWWTLARADRSKRDVLLRQTQMVVKAVNVDRLKALTGTAADLASPDYLQLKNQLADMRSADPQCRFIYLMGRLANGEVFFFVDSEPVGSKDESAAGQIYTEVAAGYRRVFDTQTAAVEGPVSDRWGTWITALVPLADPQTGTMLAVLGMDIDARVWNWDVATAAIWPVVSTLLALLALIPALRRIMPTAHRVTAQVQPEYRLERQPPRIFNLRSYALGFALLWTLIVAGLLWLTSKGASQTAMDLAQMEARSLYQRYLLLLEPAFMTQESHAFKAASTGVHTHSLGLRLSSLENPPDAMETKSLLPIKAGAVEISAVEVSDGQPVLRYLAPLVMQQQCLTCHQDQGYRPGEVCSVASVTVPLQPYLAYGHLNTLVLGLKFLVLYVLGLLGLGLASRNISQQLTRNEQMQTTLREGEARMRAITDSAQDAILMMDHEGHVSYWNPAAERMLGFSAAEAIGRNLHTFIVPSRYHAAHLAAFPVFQQTGHGDVVGKTLDLVACRKDGREISVQLSLSAVHIHHRWHAVGIMRDVTERKLAEQQLLESNCKLEAATTRANEMAFQAELANVAKSEFLANMSHEIRTPMNGVIGMTSLLLDSPLSDEQRKYAETIRLSGESLLGIINDILDFSKIEAGKLDLEVLDFDLSAVLDDFAELLALHAHDKGLEFICAAAPDVPTYLRGDPSRLRQILLNLAGNAVKFTPHGEVAVRASLISATDLAVVVRFTVRDTGIGIPSDKLAFLFDKFTQVDASTARHYGGTGLGLAISKRFVEMMGGEIGVTSSVGHGSEFWFSVRFARPEGPLPATQQASSLQGTHLLIVDDNATNREVLTIQLGAWGVRVAEAPDGPTALLMLARARAAADPFHTVILDMQMPGMDGATLARAIRADPTLQAIRLVLLTSLGQPGPDQSVADLGLSACLTKPARKADLLHSLLTNTPMAKTQAPARTQPLPHWSACRILLAEDNIINQKVALGFLGKLGLHADVVANGAEAISSLAALPYDLVLMDVQMPEMDGLEATRLIRSPHSTARNPHLPIIAMTANAMLNDQQKCLDAGMNDYISKPVTPHSLASAMEKWLPAPHAGNS